ncbi:MAG: hypothetical protein ACK4PR_07880 [Gammaproteobacteria bacterium]
MSFDLPIIAHIDLPGNYRLIRIKSAELCKTIQAGDVLHIPSLTHSLPYLRCSRQETKIDFLFYLTDENRSIMTDSMLHAASLQPTVFNLTKTDVNSFRILTCNIDTLGVGLSIALDQISRTHINLFLFDLDSASPFKLQPSKFYLPYMPDGVIANMEIIEQNNAIARFCSATNLPGCYEGTTTGLIPLLTEKLANKVVDVVTFIH